MKPALVIRKWGLPLALLCGLAGFFATGLQHVLSWQTVALYYGDINNSINTHKVATYAGFMLLYTSIVAFSLPVASLFTLAAGALIGWPAIGLIVVAATAGASLLFCAARGVLKDVLRARAGPFFKKLESGFTANAFGYLLFLRLLPIAPFWVVNILPAFSRMPLRHFVAATALGIIPGTTVYVAVGRGFNHVLAAGKTPDLAHLNAPEIWLPLAGLALLALLPTLYRYGKPAAKQEPPNDAS